MKNTKTTTDIISKYLNNIANATARRDAREESYYEYLSSFLSDFAKTINKTEVQITTLPKKMEAGNPDFRVWDGRQHIVGYIEAKKPNEKLDVIETSEQFRRYRDTFPNLILTNFYEFRLYRNGRCIDEVLIGRPFIAKKLQNIPPIENEKKFTSLLEKFFAFTLPKVFTAENLAIELAKRTRFLRDEVITKELEEEKKGRGSIYGFYEAFKKYLVANLTQNDFADIYAQTITYGLFAARTRANGEFTRRNAYELIPSTIGILRDVFQFISLGNIPDQMRVIVDDIAEVLQVADVNKILHEYYSKGKGMDPVVHFYETFLNIYDPTTRQKRGVYYTPEPVVKYIVCSIHKILKSHFKLKDGLASKKVTLLDPSAGTLTFPAEAIKLAVNEFAQKYGEGGIREFIGNHILKNFYAFELMMAPYAIGHIKISFLLEELGYQLQEDERFKLYLTNTLDMEDLEQTVIPGLESLSQESHMAAEVKRNAILVIIGNPPYSGISANSNEWTEKLLKENIDGTQSYYEVDGEHLREHKLWLQDDYVKFLRFAQWKIHKTGQGIVGMITNHSYLDNPTFRGMRQSLMNTFNEIYVLNLHGNALKKETSPDGSKDENVFDIRQGVSITIFIKNKNKKGCRVFYSDLFGSREYKYKWLEKNEFNPKIYKEINPKSPYYFFVPKDFRGSKHYSKFLKINKILPVKVSGIITARDHFVIDFNKDTLKSRIMLFKNKDIPDDIIKQSLNLSENYMWRIANARHQLIQLKEWEKYFTKIYYRPFDIRHIYYHDSVVWRTRKDIMKNMIKIENISINICKQVKTSPNWSHAFVSDWITESCYLSNKTSEICYLYPLYLIPDDNNGGNGDLFNPPKQEPIPNIAESIYSKLKEKYNNRLKPEQILSYIYAILFSNIYRKKYSEFLKIDFPSIPFTSDYGIFKKLSELGEKLIKLHLLKHPALNKPQSKYQGKGDNNKIEKIRYTENENRVYINNDKYFDSITPIMWNYYAGGYQVLKKYLEDRKNTTMDNPQHYINIATSIFHTINLQTKIDEIYDEAESDVIKF